MFWYVLQQSKKKKMNTEDIDRLELLALAGFPLKVLRDFSNRYLLDALEECARIKAISINDKNNDAPRLAKKIRSILLSRLQGKLP